MSWQCDEYSVSDKVGLQLGGLQAQVVWGPYQTGKEFRYSEADQYLCKRILASSGRNWSQEVAKAHMVSDKLSIQTYILREKKPLILVLHHYIWLYDNHSVKRFMNTAILQQ